MTPELPQVVVGLAGGVQPLVGGEFRGGAGAVEDLAEQEQPYGVGARAEHGRQRGPVVDEDLLDAMACCHS